MVLGWGGRWEERGLRKLVPVETQKHKTRSVELELLKTKVKFQKRTSGICSLKHSKKKIYIYGEGEKVIDRLISKFSKTLKKEII